MQLLPESEVQELLELQSSKDQILCRLTLTHTPTGLSVKTVRSYRTFVSQFSDTPAFRKHQMERLSWRVHFSLYGPNGSFPKTSIL